MLTRRQFDIEILIMNLILKFTILTIFKLLLFLHSQIYLAKTSTKTLNVQNLQFQSTCPL